MHDKLLLLATNAGVDTGSCTDATGVPGIAAFVWASNTISTLEAVSVGVESMSVTINPTVTFTSSGACLVKWKIISTSTTDITSAYVSGTYNTHWESGLLDFSSYVEGRVPYIVPLTPAREILQYITVIGLFSSDGLDTGRVNVRISRAETMTQFPPANAI